ncbi:hypothetical protein QT990_18560 [Microcoleus sp. T3_B1]|uniref:hypothetical protein n=1 Tax=Microcoleus sp. T3_B1 TaxID=3055425 RepID=UPI002FD51230
MRSPLFSLHCARPSPVPNPSFAATLACVTQCVGIYEDLSKLDRLSHPESQRGDRSIFSIHISQKRSPLFYLLAHIFNLLT